MTLRTFIFMILLCSCASSLQAKETPEDIQGIISTLDKQIHNSTSPDEKARLYCYQARNYTKLNRIDEARSCYIKALNSSHTGWLLNEYGYFLYNNGMYELAYAASQKVLRDFPHLSKEATSLQNMAFAKYEEEYYIKNPPTIVMDTKVDPNRVSRHDLIRQYRKTHPVPAVVKVPKTQVRTT